MKLSSRVSVLSMILFGFLLSGMVFVPAIGRAHEIPTEEKKQEVRHGFFLGLDAGIGGGEYRYEDGERTISEATRESGGFGSISLGFALSEKFALSLESYGFGSKKDNQDWELGLAFFETTFRPCGSGLFIRAGVGMGQGHFTHPVSDVKADVNDKLAFLLGIGYDWMLSDHWSVGLSAVSMGLKAGEPFEFKDDHLNLGGLALQLKWYL